MAEILDFKKQPKKPSSDNKKPNIKIVVAILVAITVVVTYIRYQTPTGLYVQGIRQSHPKNLPEVRIYDEFFEKHDSNDLLGDVTLLHFWATWCVPCVKELPSVDTLYADMHDDGLTILPISIDNKGPQPIKEFYQKLGINHLPIYLDEQKNAFNIALNGNSPALPHTIILNKEGKEVARVLGAINWNRKDVRQLLEHHLANIR